jgi:hypothetical protein
MAEESAACLQERKHPSLLVSPAASTLFCNTYQDSIQALSIQQSLQKFNRLNRPQHKLAWRSRYPCLSLTSPSDPRGASVLSAPTPTYPYAFLRQYKSSHRDRCPFVFNSNVLRASASRSLPPPARTIQATTRNPSHSPLDSHILHARNGRTHD